MTHFIGSFYVVTRHSVFQVAVKGLTVAPVVTKVRIRPEGKELVVPVGGVLLGGFYVAITVKGIVKYSMKNHQRAPLEVPPEHIEKLSKNRRAMRTARPVGLFMKRVSADDCYDVINVPISDGVELAQAFDSRWFNDSVTVLRTVGSSHPLITVSTDGEFAVPVALLELADILPATAPN